jgi:hypothetical protein
MGSTSAPLPCLHRDGREFLAHISIGTLVFEGRQCVVTLLRAVSPQQDAFARQRTQDQALIERGQLMNALLAMAPAMLFALQRQADGNYACALRSDACAQGLHVAHTATPAEWMQQWFHRVVPADLPRLIAAIEAAALARQPLQLQWSHHVQGHGVRALQLSSGPPELLADGSQVWLCSVLPGQEKHLGH